MGLRPSPLGTTPLPSPPTLLAIQAKVVGKGYGGEIPRSLQIFFTRSSLISEWRGTVEVFRVERLTNTEWLPPSKQLAAVLFEMANKRAAFHALTFSGSRMISPPWVVSRSNSRLASRTRATAS